MGVACLLQSRVIMGKNGEKNKGICMRVAEKAGVAEGPVAKYGDLTTEYGDDSRGGGPWKITQRVQRLLIKVNI